MSNSVFQSVMVQLKEAANCAFGVVDSEGCVISCTDHSLLGERWEDAVLKAAATPDVAVTFGQKTFRAMISSTNYLEYAVFCSGDDEQAKLLSLFDGTAGGKKMYIVTCNELYGLNDYIVNRPGRFHYHFRFEYPTATEIREYLEDKLEKKCYGEIDKVIEFAGRINLNYDCLRAIAFELNLGATFEEAIVELNILNVDMEEYDKAMNYDRNEGMLDVAPDGVKMDTSGTLLEYFQKHRNV